MGQQGKVAPKSALQLTMIYLKFHHGPAGPGWIVLPADGRYLLRLLSRSIKVSADFLIQVYSKVLYKNYESKLKSWSDYKF